ncbi:MAG: hypothetical protein ACOYLB_02925 [Phototrophicaceae bacterium]
MKFQLPDMQFVAIGSEREFNLAKLNRPTLLVVQNEYSATIAESVHEKIRRVYPFASELLIISIADLQNVPKLLQYQVTTLLTTAYNNAVATLPSILPAEDYVVILPDWTGKVARSLDVYPYSRVPSVVVVDGKNEVLGKYTGTRIEEGALLLLSELSEIKAL